jgi:hypothetical protein
MENWIKLDLGHEPTVHEQRIFAGAIAMVLGKNLIESKDDWHIDVLETGLGCQFKVAFTEDEGNRLANVLQKTIPNHELEISI